MAVRHDVENLIRRGNIFYWRARVPMSFTRCRPGSPLSLSLHCSDHKKAQAIGRKLNMLMAELKMKSKEPMSKELLQKLCEHERDVMLLHLEDVALAARRYGRPADIEELELDLENGWAYKLLAMFGIRQHLTLKEGCSGHRYLVANGVPASHIPAIKSNYIELYDETNSRAFQDGIRMLMDQFGIAQHPLNHEKAMKAYFEGRAEALFEVDDRHPLADRNLSEFTGGSRQKRRADAPQAAQTEATPIAAERTAPPAAVPAPQPPGPTEPPAITMLDLRPTPHSDGTEQGEPSVPPAARCARHAWHSPSSPQTAASP